jgi:hypothetical protein
MPRYFFNTRVGGDFIADKEGVVLKDPDRAWELARGMIENLLSEGADTRLMNAILEVTDEAGEIVLEFPFVEVVGLSPPSSNTGD